MYRGKNRDENYLFKELMPFGGKLEKENRWLKIKEMIPWGELEGEYAKYFSWKERPGLDGRLVIGLFLLKYMSNRSDREVILELQENVYWQAFCSFEGFVTSEQIKFKFIDKDTTAIGAEVHEGVGRKNIWSVD